MKTKNLKFRNMVIEKKKIKILILFLAIAVISFIFDKKISLFISSIKINFLLPILVFLSYAGSFYIVPIISALFFLKKERIKILFPLWTSFAITSIISLILKIITNRERPYQFFNFSLPKFLTSYNWDKSFPSIHAALAFSALPFFEKEYPKFKYVWLIFAIFVSLSRVFLNVHYLSDVLFGALIGYLIGSLLLKIKILNKK